MTAEKTSLRSGERTGFQVVVSGPEQIPASAWQDDGTVNLRIENKSPNVTMKGEQGRVIEKKLKRSDFSGGPYVYKGELQATSAGGFRINGEVNPRFRPVRAPATLVPRGDAR
jgi:autotransporter translocation and assembly factor TamB